MTHFLTAFFSGMFLFNSIPHLVQGICGKRHMTPFGVKSSAAVNIIWGWVNIIAGGLLLYISGPGGWGIFSLIVFCAGGFIISIYLAFFWSNPDARLPWQ